MIIFRIFLMDGCGRGLTPLPTSKEGLPKDKSRKPDDCEVLPYLRVANVQRGYLDLSEMKEIIVPNDKVDSLLLEPGDVLFNEGGDRDKLGRGWVWNGQIQRCTFQNHVFRARFYLPEAFEPKFISWYANTFGQDYFMAKGKQTTNLASINKTMLSAFPVPVAPIEQQRSIVAEIEKQFSRLDEAVANLKRVQANLKRYKAAVLKAAVEGKLTEEWRKAHPDVEPASKLLDRILAERRAEWEEAELAKMEAKGKVPKDDKWKGKYKEPGSPNTDGLPELPDGWVWSTVNQLVAHLTDGDHQPPPQRDRGIPFLVIGNVRNGKVDFSNTRYVGEEYYSTLDPCRQPKVGDLLYTLVGSYGIPVRVKTDKPFCIQRHMAILRPHDKSPMDYLTVAMESNNVFKQATSIATGTAQKTVPLAGLREIHIALPPLNEQQQIVSELDHRLTLLQKNETQVEINLQRANRLRIGNPLCHHRCLPKKGERVTKGLKNNALENIPV